MHKTELIQGVYDSANQGDFSSFKACERAVNNVLAIIAGELEKGGSVTLTGFGTFSVTSRQERDGRNPRTGEFLTIPAQKGVHFKPSTSLKEAVNG